MCRALRVFAYLPFVILCVCSAIAQNPPTVPADQIWRDLAAGNHRFVVGKTASRDLIAQRQALTKSQHPRVTVLSCSDSRVPPPVRPCRVAFARRGNALVAPGCSTPPTSLPSFQCPAPRVGIEAA